MLDRYKDAPVLEETITNIDDGVTTRVLGGLHHISANPAPYFSLTYAEFDAKGVEIRSGAWGERLQDLFPEFDDLFALINADIHGVPMHVEKNGWYWLGMTPVQIFDEAQVCVTFRIEALEANFLRQEIMKVLQEPIWWSDREETAPLAPAWEFYLGWIKDQHKRWKADAESVIKAHDLVVFGDPWPQA